METVHVTHKGGEGVQQVLLCVSGIRTRTSRNVQLKRYRYVTRESQLFGGKQLKMAKIIPR